MSRISTFKRLLAMVLCVCMVLGMAPVAAMTAEESATVTLYFNNTANWSTVNIYYWSGNTGMTTWPGDAMSDQGDGIWAFDVPAGATYVVFNNGSAQTGDLPIPTNGDNLYTLSTNSWSKHTPGDPGEYMHIYFCNNRGWNDVNLYYWGSSNAEDPDWPGIAMELYRIYDSEEYYVLEVPTDITGMVISGTVPSGTEQTTDIIEGWYDGVCYSAVWNGDSIFPEGNPIDSYIPPDAGDDNTGSEPVDTVTLYFNNTADWEQVSAYYWGGASSISWPGIDMTDLGGGIWTVEVPADAVNVVFSNGGNGSQTPDQQIPTNGDNLYTFSTDSWSVNTFPGDTPEPDPDPTGHTYTVTGAIAPGHVDAGMFGSAWDIMNTANDMVYDAVTGLYSITYTNVPATGETVDYDDTWYEYMVVQDHDWAVSYNENGITVDGINAKFDVEQDGSTVVIYFDGTKVWAEVTSPSGGDEEEIPTGYTVEIDGTVTNYTDFREAVIAACAADSATLTLHQDVEGGIYGFNSGNVTLNLNGKTIGGRLNIDGCTLMITDTAENKGTIVNYSGSAFSYYSGRLIILDTVDFYGNTAGNDPWHIGRAYGIAADTGTIGSTGTEDIVIPADYVALVVTDKTPVTILPEAGQLIFFHRHNWTDASCMLPMVCFGCGATAGEAEGHKFGEDGICTVCNADVNCLMTIELADSYGDGWTGNGIKVYENGVLMVTVTLLDGNSFTWTGAYDPEKEYEFYWESGSYSDECSFEILFAGEVVFTASENDCDSYPDNYRFFPVCEHIFESVVTPPTCTTEGYTTRTCTLCGITYVEDRVDALGHSKDEGVATVPTCTDSGYTSYTCTVCGESHNDDYVEALGHVLGEDGNCTVCGELYTVPVWVADVQITSENMADILGDGTAAYDPVSNTLTLNGFTYEGSSYGVASGKSLNIVLIGENSITSEQNGLYFNFVTGSIHIGGTGSLRISADYTGIQAYVDDDLDLIIGGSVTIDIASNYYEGIYMFAESTDLLIEDNVKLTIGSENAPLSAACIYVDGDTSGSVTISGNADITLVNDNEEGIYVNGEEQSITITGGDIYINANQDGLDANTITISGGVVEVYGGEGNEGIYSDDLTITGGTVIAGGKDQAIEADNITISGGTVTVTKGGMIAVVDETEIGTSGTITLAGVEIAEPEGATFGTMELEDEGTVTAVLNADGSYADAFVIRPVESNVKNGIYAEDGSLFYYENDVRTYAGLKVIDGDYYYIRTSGEVVHGRSYWITKTNGLLPAANYYFNDEGKLSDRNGIVEENGSLYYYENGVRTYAGLIEIDGDHYYVRTSGEVVTGRRYWISKTNGLLPAASYYFDEDGKMQPPRGAVKNGIYQEGNALYYYENGERVYAGLKVYTGDLILEDGTVMAGVYDNAYIYVRTSGEVVANRSYWITKTNGLLDAANYTFNENGILIEST